MKTISMKDAREQLANLVEQAQSEPVWLTRHGKPVAMLLGVEGRVDIGSVIIEGRPEFWEMVERVRKSKRPRHSEADVRKKLGLPAAKKAG
jgi:prevent-host-death family protein